MVHTYKQGENRDKKKEKRRKEKKLKRKNTCTPLPPQSMNSMQVCVISAQLLAVGYSRKKKNKMTFSNI